MITYAIPLWLIVFALIFLLILMGLVAWLVIISLKQFFLDAIMFIDKNNRWNLYRVSLKGRKEINWKKSAYALVEKCGLVNHRGKVLYVFAEGKPQPLKLDYNKAEWLDSQSLMAIINNRLVQQIVKPTDSLKDSLMLFGAIGGLVAGLASVLILLIQLGVIGG